MKIIWIVAALLAGAFLPLQAGLNARLAKAIDSPVHASLISFIVGSMAVFLYSVLIQQHVSWSGIRTVPVYTWLSGVCGAFTVTAIILAFPRIGPTLTFGLVVSGQLLISVLLDHFKILVAQQHPINFRRIGGIALIIIGVIIIRKF
jgi:bacterial/archaeal transporter family-2 protein